MNSFNNENIKNINRIVNLKKFEVIFNDESNDDYQKIEKFNIIAPITCEPNPPILGIIATVIALVEKIRNNSRENEDKIFIIFLFMGDVIVHLKDLREDIQKHYEHYLPDYDDKTINNLLYLRKSEFETFIKNIFLSVNWNPQISSVITRNISFENIFTGHNNKRTEFSQTIEKEIMDMGSSVFSDSSKLKQKLYCYNNSYENKNSEYPPITEILIQYLCNPPTNRENTKNLLILPETGYKIIQKLNDNDNIKQNYENLSERIKTDLIYFTETSRGDISFPTYYNELSRDYLIRIDTQKEIIKLLDELYYAGLLKTLNCSFFMPYAKKENPFMEIEEKISKMKDEIKENYEDYLSKLESYNKESDLKRKNEAKILSNSYCEKCIGLLNTYSNFLEEKIKNDIFYSIENGFLITQELTIQQFELII